MPQAIPAVAGAVVSGAMAKKSGGGGSTSKVELDPRMQQILYGDYTGGGVLGDMNNLFRSQMAQGGLHPLQVAGLEAQRQVLTHPSFTQGFDDMRSLGRGLMGGGVAANPFTSGGGFRPGAYGAAGGMGGGMSAPMGDSYGPRSAAGMGYGPAVAHRPGGGGFGYNMGSGNLMEVMRPISPYQSAAPAPATGGAGGAGGMNPTDLSAAIEEYLQRKAMEQLMWIGGPGNASSSPSANSSSTPGPSGDDGGPM